MRPSALFLRTRGGPSRSGRGRPALAAALAAAAMLLAGCGEGAERPFVTTERRPNLLLITIDTLRADHLGCYGHGRDVSPEIDRLAAQGVRFENARAQAPWTLPSMASLLTSLYPSRHGAVDVDRGLRQDATTLAEVLGEDYRTMAVVSHVFVSKKYGFQKGFQVFDQENVADHHAVTSPALTARAIDLLRARPDDRPFFLWVHYFDPHTSFVRHAEWDFDPDYEGPLPEDVLLRTVRENLERMRPRDWQNVRARYDGEIAFTDRWIGELLRFVRAEGLWEDTVICLTADHGEEFLDHGDVGHGKYCYDELVRVPLILGGALADDLRGKVVQTPVETRAVPRTFAALAGADAEAFEGEDLLSAARIARQTFTLSEGSYAWGATAHERALVFRDWKLIEGAEGRAPELYHLGRDRGERENLFGHDDEEVRAATALLQGELERRGSGGADDAASVELSAEDGEHLRALGYGE